MVGTKILSVQKSKFNGNLRVIKSWGMGTYIQANGLTQSGGVVETIWRSTLKQINDSTIHPFNNVLVLGLGGGTVAKLVHKNWPKASITGIDIDRLIVELGKRYLGLDESVVKIKIQDASKLVPGRFDLVIVDLYNGDQFPKKFEDEKFLKWLSKYPLVIFNRLYYKENKNLAEEFSLKLHKFFNKVRYYYPEANLMFFCYNR